MEVFGSINSGIDMVYWESFQEHFMKNGFAPSPTPV